MQPCNELEEIIRHHYGKFDAGGQAQSIHEMYSLQDGVVIIGSDPEEWVDERSALLDWIHAGGNVRAEITVQNLKAMSEGSVGWTMDSVTVQLPNGAGIPVRHTRIFHKEDGAWKMVHLHVSVAVPDEK